MFLYFDYEYDDEITKLTVTCTVNSLLHSLKVYIVWLPKTIHLHGIHSPFIFAFEKKCLRGNTPALVKQQLHNYRKQLFANKTELEIKDNNLDSRIFKFSNPKVCDIARGAKTEYKTAALLSRIVSYLEIQNILEVGTSLGLETAGLASSKCSKVVTISTSKSTSNIVRKHLQKLDYKNVEVVLSENEIALKKLQKRNFDLIYFGMNHSHTWTVQQAKLLQHTAHNDTLWIFENIHHSSETTKSWKEIQKLSNVTATIDMFQFGFVFFRKEQGREEFQIRL